jgi:hypothetical protein
VTGWVRRRCQLCLACSMSIAPGRRPPARTSPSSVSAHACSFQCVFSTGYSANIDQMFVYLYTEDLAQPTAATAAMPSGARTACISDLVTTRQRSSAGSLHNALTLKTSNREALR